MRCFAEFNGGDGVMGWESRKNAPTNGGMAA